MGVRREDTLQELRDGPNYRSFICQLLFTLPFFPWSHCSVKVVCRELLRTQRIVGSGLSLPHNSWPALLPFVQSALKNNELARFVNVPSVTAFTGLPAQEFFGLIKIALEEKIALSTPTQCHSVTDLHWPRWCHHSRTCIVQPVQEQIQRLRKMYRPTIAERAFSHAISG